MRVLLTCAALGALVACSPQVPDSGAGVGFDRVDRDRMARVGRDAQLEGAAPVTTTALDSDSAAAARRASSGVSPIEVDPGNPPPQAVTDGTGLSREQDFQAVSGQRDIDDDAARIRAAQSQYQIIQPTELPTRTGDDRPNIVAYALKTNNPMGVSVYERSSFNTQSKHQRNCASYPSPDLAQEDFLSSGGPQKDRKALDPDGDGFACSWDPRPFRRVSGN